MTVSVLVLGGYGNFGKRIVQSLAVRSDITIYIAGRSIKKAEALALQLQPEAKATLCAIALDINAVDFSTRLIALKPFITIHTSGPFQGQDYQVPLACIQAGSHYIDLADDRRFVCDIRQLNQQALDKQVLVVSGASSVPGLSSTVIDFYQPKFKQINQINIAIAPGNKAERGEATLRGILSFTGKSFAIWKNAMWTPAYGWMDAKVLDFGDTIGKRWLANVNIPDLELFPERYPNVKTVTFQAGLELPILHLAMVAMAGLYKYKLAPNWALFTKGIMQLSYMFNRFGTDKGGMRISIAGIDLQNRAQKIDWTLYANNGIGPYIPTFSAIILAEKILDGNLTLIGATPCLNLYTLEDFVAKAKTYGIYMKEVHSNE